MYNHFSTDFFVGNRNRLRELFVGTAPIVLSAHGLMQRSADTTFSFRQDSNFWYLTGCPYPDVVLVIDKTKEYLIVPEHDDIKEVFDGAIDRAELSRTSGIETIYGATGGWKKLQNRLRRVKHVATLAALPAYVEHYNFYSNPSRANLVERFKAINDQLELLDLRSQLALMRMIKQPSELAAIQEAIDITIKGIKFVQKRTYRQEYQIEAALTEKFRSAGAQGHAFDPVIGSGARACIMHNYRMGPTIDSKDLILLDVGAEVNNYSADISRTYAQGPVSKRQRAIHGAVVAVQDYAFGLIKPGVLIRENEQLVEHFMGEKLRELGLIKTIDRDSVRKFFPHATSHFLGLDTHDAGDYQRPLEQNMVLTVEPGIYVPAEGIGVRIEDDVLVTASGYKILSRRLPRELA